MTDQLQIPAGFTIIANSVVLMLVRSEEVNNNPGVHATCTIDDGEQELLRRYFAANSSTESDNDLSALEELIMEMADGKPYDNTQVRTAIIHAYETLKIFEERIRKLENHITNDGDCVDKLPTGTESE